MTGGQRLICQVCGKKHRQGIGGTAMAKILGVYDLTGETALDVYHDLTRPPLDKMDAVMPIDLLRGVTHEPTAAGFYFGKTERQGRKAAGVIESKNFPAFQCHPDYDIFTKDGEDEFKGTGTLEIKCPRLKRFIQIVETGVRKSELIQLQTYLAVARRKWGSFAFYHLEHDSGPVLVIDQLADPVLGKFILKHGQRFWDEHVTPRIAPDPYAWASLLQDDEAPAVTETMGDLLFIPKDEINGSHLDVAEATFALISATTVRKEAEELERERKAALGPLVDALYDTDRIELESVAKITHVRQKGHKGFNRRSLEGHRPIDRDKLEAWLRDEFDGDERELSPEDEGYVIVQTVGDVLGDLSLDLSRFDTRGAPFSFLKITPKGDL